MRREKFVNGNVYHIFNRSISGYRIFNYPDDFKRFIASIKYYQIPRKVSFSTYLKVNKIKNPVSPSIIGSTREGPIVEIIGFCLMPTHIHLILLQTKDDGISTFMNNLLNSYTRYFNLKIKRKGPLWEGRFKSVLVQTDEQLLHLTRYIHLNPVTAYIVDRPEQWEFSSYKEFIGERNREEKICNFDKILDIEPESYREFVNDNINFQRELAKIKKLLIE